MAPVDLTDLRTMTDGDRELEMALFQEFFSAIEEGIHAMSRSIADGANETWRATAHALKGSAYNIGALAMGELCKYAQDNPDATGEEKTALLEKISEEYTLVRAYLTCIHTD